MILYMVNIYKKKKTLKRVLESFKSALMTDCNQAVLLQACCGTHNRGSVKKKKKRESSFDNSFMGDNSIRRNTKRPHPKRALLV